jgi:hypothetical protein
MANGGKVDIPILIARKVVPQKMETAQNASHPMAFGDKFNVCSLGTNVQFETIFIKFAVNENNTY